MTEIIIIALLLTAVVWVSRMLRGVWCRMRGVEHDTSSHGPLPIVRVWHLVHAWWDKLTGWLRRRKPNSDSGSTQTE